MLLRTKIRNDCIVTRVGEFSVIKRFGVVVIYKGLTR